MSVRIARREPKPKPAEPIDHIELGPQKGHGWLVARPNTANDSVYLAAPGASLHLPLEDVRAFHEALGELIEQVA